MDANPMLDVYREQNRELESRIKALEAELGEQTVIRWWLKNAVIMLLNGMDGVNLAHEFMRDQTTKARLTVRDLGSEVSFSVVDLEPGEASGEQFPIVTGKDLGRGIGEP